MTFWQFLTNVFTWLEERTTRIIAVVLGTVTALVSTGVLPEAQLKYWAAAITVLTYWRAQAVSNTVASARAIVKQQQVDSDSPLETYVLQASPPPPKD